MYNLIDVHGSCGGNVNVCPFLGAWPFITRVQLKKKGKKL